MKLAVALLSQLDFLPPLLLLVVVAVAVAVGTHSMFYAWSIAVAEL